MKDSYKTAAIIGEVGALIMSALFKFIIEPKTTIQYQPPQIQQQSVNIDSLKKEIIKELNDTSRKK
jgi:hypothetical protein